MEIKIEDGVKVMKLNETHPEEMGTSHDTDAMAMFRIWSHLGGEDEMRDLTVGHRELR